MVKDVNPQFIRARVVESATNTYTEIPVSLPTVQQLSDGKSLVIEILKIFINTQMPDFQNVIISDTTVQLTTKPQTDLVRLSNPTTIFTESKTIFCVDTAATDATLVYKSDDSTKVYDYSDGAGNGYLVGSNLVYFGIKGTNNMAAKNANIAILYRLKKVGASELIGMIQH